VTSEWVEWHRRYEDGQPLTRRLEVVQDAIRAALDRQPPGAVRALSMCAGDGRDLIGVLERHPRGRDVVARLVELDPALADTGRRRAAGAGLAGVEMVEGDASTSSAYAGIVPADLLLVCGVFGNITDEDVRRTVEHLPELCAPGATVVWTRGRFEPDLTPTIRRWFAEVGFEERSFVAIPDTTMSVGSHRLTADPRPYRAGVRLFTFLPLEERPSQRSEARRASTSA
jgi:Putative methyltransferase